jgi:hypothetical protein
MTDLVELEGKNISGLLDISYGNLRVVCERKGYTETVVISGDQLLQLIQSINYVETLEPRHNYPHLMPIIEE